mgnify:FL=1
MRAPIRRLHSHSHSNTVVNDGYQGTRHGQVHIVQTNGAPLTEHWKLQIQLDQPHEPFARVQSTEESTVAMVSFYPQMKEDKVFTEIVFVVDRSGSMGIRGKMQKGNETNYQI